MTGPGAPSGHAGRHGPGGPYGPSGPDGPAGPQGPGGTAGPAGRGGAEGPDAGRRPDEPAIDLDGDLGIRPEVVGAAWSTIDGPTAAALLAGRTRAGVGTGTAPEPADLAPTTRHLWVPDTSGPVAALRVVRAVGGAAAPAVQRVWVREDVRHLGLASALLAGAVARFGGRSLVAEVPAESVALFTRFGFVPGETVLHGGDPVTVLTRVVRAADTPWRD